LRKTKLRGCPSRMELQPCGSQAYLWGGPTKLLAGRMNGRAGVKPRAGANRWPIVGWRHYLDWSQPAYLTLPRKRRGEFAFGRQCNDGTRLRQRIVFSIGRVSTKRRDSGSGAPHRTRRRRYHRNRGSFQNGDGRAPKGPVANDSSNRLLRSMGHERSRLGCSAISPCVRVAPDRVEGAAGCNAVGGESRIQNLRPIAGQHGWSSGGKFSPWHDTRRWMGAAAGCVRSRGGGLDRSHHSVPFEATRHRSTMCQRRHATTG